MNKLIKNYVSLSQLKLNIITNYISKLWTNLLSFLLVPIYLYYLGIEAYGLIGAFYTITSFINLLDLGLGTTLNREVALRNSTIESKTTIPNLLKTAEIIYWCMSVALIILLVLLTPIISTQWLKADKLNSETIHWAVVILGFTIAIRWAITPYKSTLIGLEKQVSLNIFECLIITLRDLGGIAILLWVSRTIVFFLFWQGLIAVIEVFLFVILAWQNLPIKNIQARFEIKIIQQIWQFAMTVNWTTLVSLLLTQLDKILLSKFVSLEKFGYYAIAYTLASSIITIFQPFMVAISPHLTILIAQGKIDKLKYAFHKSSLFITILITPIATVFIFFAPTVLEIWTHSPEVITQASEPLRLLSFGILMGSMIQVQYLLQLAIGKPQIYALFGTFSVLFATPMFFLLLPRFELIGAAIIWAILNTVYYLLFSRITHFYILPNEYLRWLFQDTLIPMIICFTVSFINFQLQSYFPEIQIISIGIVTVINYGLLFLWYKYQIKSMLISSQNRKLKI
ncbi:polysaccharide biosynthesis protein [Nostoc sp. PCC 7107]|nr:polysaccharide biosynthesis protein [Nostoc sp. PCC 7107]